MDKTRTNDRVAEKVYDTDGIHSITNDENQYEKENSSILIKNSFVLQENQQLNIQNNVTNQHNNSPRLSYIPIKESQNSNPILVNIAPKKFVNKSNQVSIKPQFRSIGIAVKCKTAEKCTSTSDLEAYPSKETINHTFPANNLQQLDADLASLSVGTDMSSKTISEYKPSSGEIRDSEEWDLQMKRNALNLTLYFITTDPKRHIGVPPEWLWLLEHLSTVTGINTDDIKLTLMKIKLNDTFVRLGNQFGISSTKASNVFNKTILKIAPVLDKFIYFPGKETVIKAMPIQFRANYSHVLTIIDAFEIEIQKP